MSAKVQEQSNQSVDEKEPQDPKKKASGTLAEGGMSPLADRKDPTGWAKSVPAAPATQVGAPAPAHGRPVTPSEPIGGWVDGSTGRGKVLVPRADAQGRTAKHPVGERAPSLPRGDEKAPAVGVERPADGRKVPAPPPPKDAQAAAVAAAEERKEED